MQALTPEWPAADDWAAGAYATGLVVMGLGIPLAALGALLFPVSGGLIDLGAIARGFGGVLILLGGTLAVFATVVYQVQRHYSVERKNDFDFDTDADAE
jgi:hypothetical protein